METLIINVPEQKSKVVKLLLKELGVTIQNKTKGKKMTMEALNKKFKTETDETKMTKEEFFAKLDKSIQQAKNGEVRELTPELKKELFKSIL
jgi:hypothetical protein